MKPDYCKYLTSAAKAKYIVESNNYIRTDSLMKIMRQKITSKRFDKMDGMFIAFDYTDNSKAPWNNNRLYNCTTEDTFAMSGIFSELTALIEEGDIDMILTDKSLGVKEINLVEATDPVVLGDKCLLFIEIVDNKRNYYSSILYPVNEKGESIIMSRIDWYKRNNLDNLADGIWEDWKFGIKLKEMGGAEFFNK